MTPASRRLAPTVPAPTAAPTAAVLLFRVVTTKDEIIIGLAQGELEALGSGPEAERIGRALAANGQIGAWRYVVGRAADGSTRYGATSRIAILRQDSLRIEPYSAALPVAPPPG